MKLLSFIFCLNFLPLLSFGQILNDGTLVKSEGTAEIYLVINRHLHHVPSMKVLENLFTESPAIQIVSDITLELLPKGSPLEQGQLIMGSNKAVYLQYDRYKTHIPNPETFNIYSFDWGKIKSMGDEEIAKFITLIPISKLEQDVKHYEPKPCGNRD